MSHFFIVLMKITLVAGARPNFMKIAPIIHEIKRRIDKGNDITYRLVHTGQHYDEKMSHTFFKQLNIPEPDTNLECGGGTQAEQTAAIMVAFEKDLVANPTDLVLVVGDVTSTMACSIVAKKMNVKVAHVEAGIRSFDLTMPEEINRMVTDSITDYFFTTSETANLNLQNAGISNNRVFYVGNVMIDTLLHNRTRFTPPTFWEEFKLNPKNYFVLTLHRPANVDNPNILEKYLNIIATNAGSLPVIFPIHPRTRKNLKNVELLASNLMLVEPLGYLEFNYLVEHSSAVITDSGGITEETTVLGVPCITLRDNTERPETVSIGTNELIGTNPDAIPPYMSKILKNQWKNSGIPPFWDGKTAERIVSSLTQIFDAA